MPFLAAIMVLAPAFVGRLEAQADVAHHPDAAIVTSRDSIPWRDGPWPGVQIANLERGGEGPERGTTFLLKLPDGFWIAPHHHPSNKRITVLSGTVLLAFGDEFTPDSAERLPAGSFALVPSGEIHYEGAQGETVVQFSAVGPWGTIFVDPDVTHYRLK